LKLMMFMSEFGEMVKKIEPVSFLVNFLWVLNSLWIGLEVYSFWLNF
jgi:hypothetical protein